MNTSTQGQRVQSPTASVARRGFLGTALAAVAASVGAHTALPNNVAPAIPPDGPRAAPDADAALMRDEVRALCLHMLYLRSWWEHHGDAIRASDRKRAAEIHDNFVDGAMFARGIARVEGFDLDEQSIRSHAWGEPVA
jgi:hypothetical protein